MRILNELLIEKFKRRYSNSRKPLDNWVDIIRSSTWDSLVDLKATFPSADYVAPYIVFNVEGNNFRLVAIAVFSQGELTVVRIMTHSEYDRWKP
jgi:mRNA interferase HigB